MQTELWWLFLFILPIFFTLGWISARWDMRLEKRENEIEQIAQKKSTFKGLDLLLNKESDKAIDALVEIAKLDPETTELHFILGNLFRRRGEIERAIRVHKHLADRVDLEEEHRNHAIYELGLDFLRAGILDCAEISLYQVNSSSRYYISSKESLLKMYQTEKDWIKATALAKELETLQNRNKHKEISHFQCELAIEEIQFQNLEKGLIHINQALLVVPNHPRAFLLKGNIALFQKKYELAIETWKILVRDNPVYWHLVADHWMQAYKEMFMSDFGLNQLIVALKKQASGELLDITFRYVFELKGIEFAEALMTEIMMHTPSLSAVAFQTEARLAIAKSKGWKKIEQELLVTLNVLKIKTHALARYTCKCCGFRTRCFYWQCPGCNEWETYPPNRTEGNLKSLA